MQKQVVRRIFSSSKNLYRRASTFKEKADEIVKYKEPIVIISTLLGGVGVFGGFISLVVGDRVQQSERQNKAERELRAKSLEMERDLRVKDLEMEHDELRKSQQLLYDAKLNEYKARTEAELRARFLDAKYHADYDLLRKEHLQQPKE